jgi:hypothetical protein
VVKVPMDDGWSESKRELHKVISYQDLQSELRDGSKLILVRACKREEHRICRTQARFGMINMILWRYVLC